MIVIRRYFTSGFERALGTHQGLSEKGATDLLLRALGEVSGMIEDDT